MAYRVIQLKTGRSQPDDKDHFKNKRLRLGGPLLADLFRVSFRNLTRDIKYQLERIGVKGPIITVSAAVRPGIITERFQHALATGNWGRGRVGITQLLDRTNYISTLSHLRRLQSPLSRSQPNFEARDLHPTHWGRLCPNETPEGSNCGLVKNLALSASIAVGVNPDKIKQLLFEMGTVPAYEATIELRISGAKVFVDGNIIGYCNNPQEMVQSFRQKRRAGEISTEVNVTYFSKAQTETEEVHANCDEGRVRRPLIIVENGVAKLGSKHFEKIGLGEWTWEDVVKNGLVEYLDAEEEENAFIALSFDAIDSRKHPRGNCNLHNPWNMRINNSLSRTQPVTKKLIPSRNGKTSPRRLRHKLPPPCRLTLTHTALSTSTYGSNRKHGCYGLQTTPHWTKLRRCSAQLRRLQHGRRHHIQQSINRTRLSQINLLPHLRSRMPPIPRWLKRQIHCSRTRHKRLPRRTILPASRT